jgi:hypothetical protein
MSSAKDKRRQATRKRRQARRKAEAENLGQTMAEFTAVERVLNAADETVAAEKHQRYWDLLIAQKLKQSECVEEAIEKVRRQLGELHRMEDGPAREEQKAVLRSRYRELKALLRQI